MRGLLRDAEPEAPPDVLLLEAAPEKCNGSRQRNGAYQRRKASLQRERWGWWRGRRRARPATVGRAVGGRGGGGGRVAAPGEDGRDVSG